MAYNLTNFTNTTSLGDYWVVANNTSGGFMAATLLVSLYIIIFSLSKNYDTYVAHIVSSFSITIISGMMFFIGLIAWEIAIVPLILFMGMLIAYQFR